MKIESFISKGVGNLGYSALSLIVSLLIAIPAVAAPKIFNGELVVNGLKSEAATLGKVSNLRVSRKFTTPEVVEFNKEKFDADCIELAKKLNRPPALVSCEPNYAFEVNAKPNDAYQRLQYAHDLMKLPQAWDITQGDSSVIVAVIDTGVDLTHEDLVNNLWVNQGEIDANGIDDDGNGLVDDYVGADFTDDTGSANDDHGHGTHVAGIIGGEGNNSIGVAGVAWKVKIMPLKFIGAGGVGSGTNAARAIDYAVDHGAKIINASWGAIGAQATVIEDAIKRARDKGVLFVAAAGNDGVNTDQATFYPAGFDVSNIISVGATDNKDERAVFSNFGEQSVDLAAPGVSIVAPYPGLGYAYLSGTSMAAPQVAGVAALITSLQGDLSPQTLKYLLIESGDQVAALSGTSSSARRVNAYQAIIALGSLPQGASQTYSLSVSPSKKVLRDSAKATTIKGAFFVNVSSSAGLSSGAMQLEMKLGEYSCNIAAFEFSGENVQLKGKLASGLVGGAQFSLINDSGEVATQRVKINSKKKNAKAARLAKISLQKKASLCNSVASAISYAN